MKLPILPAPPMDNYEIVTNRVNYIGTEWRIFDATTTMSPAGVGGIWNFQFSLI